MTKLPNGWEVKKLGDICKLYQPKTITMNEIKSSGKYKVYGANGVIGYYDEYNHENSEVAMACRGATCGYINYTEPKSWITGNAMIITPLDESIYKRYLIYALPLYRVKDIITGSAQPQITRTNLSKIQIPLPSLEEQRKIVKILDEKFASIDESIRLVKDDLLSLDELWQSILNDSFNPLKSKLDNDTYTLPPTWKWEKLGDICEKTKNANLKDFNDDISYIDISSIDNKNFMILDCKKINSTQAPSRAKRQVKFGDILYATTRPNLKNIAMVNQEYYNPIASTGFCVVRAKKDVKKYIFYFLLSDYVTDFVARFIKGAQYPAVSDKDIFNIQIPLPPLKEQERIAKELESKAKTIKELKELYTKRLKDYEELKESLLDLAFKGGL